MNIIFSIIKETSNTNYVIAGTLFCFLLYFQNLKHAACVPDIPEVLREYLLKKKKSYIP